MSFKVSIHAPARGATFGRHNAIVRRFVSIHAPARGATADDYPGWGYRDSFNPRPCARGDIQSGFAALRPGCFNPRPCARGDSTFPKSASSNRCFNPRPCARGDGDLDLIGCTALTFQSTPLREGRLHTAMPLDALGSVSIHAPARGATPKTPPPSPIGRCFNPRPCARGDDHFRLPHSRMIPFQSTPLREGRRNGGVALMSSHGFQSTPLREGRPPARNRTAPCSKFQSTPLREGRPYVQAISDADAGVSIHAPARGATAATDARILHLLAFQSTPLREGRHGADETARRLDRVSIHAPARGATVFAGDMADLFHEFQSTPLREGRRVG